MPASLERQSRRVWRTAAAQKIRDRVDQREPSVLAGAVQHHLGHDATVASPDRRR